MSKWQKTGLLEGLGDRGQSNMSLLLENQAKELLREANSMQSGDVEGFAAVAFPLVRRVFGELIAEKLVSVQTMNLPNGLIFFLDFKYGNTKTSTGAVEGESIFGGGRLAKEIAEGIDLTNLNNEKGFYNLNNGYSSPTASFTMPYSASAADGHMYAGLFTASVGTSISQTDQKYVQFDPDCLQDATDSYVGFRAQISAANLTKMNLKNLVAMELTGSELSGAQTVRRLTTFAKSGTSGVFSMVLKVPNGVSLAQVTGSTGVAFVYPHADQFVNGGALGTMKGADEWYFEALTGDRQEFPEINIKIDSVSITAVTKKLRVKWTPELSQDLDAYHNIDAEVELTNVLSETIAQEIDREILVNLIRGATASVQYWSRMPGKFVNPETGAPLDTDPTTLNSYPDFTGNVSQWYETLIERINDVSAQIHRKVLRGGATFLVCGPETSNILEFTAGFRANTTADEPKGTVNVLSVGSVNKKWDVYVDPQFPRNLVLIGRKGSGFLESGYVYAPYVPLQITPTIFEPEQFTPTKAVWTRYGHKMVRSDMYGLVIITDLVPRTQ
jgi:hypothetical protein